MCKHQSKDDRARVRQILLREWDPIEIDAAGPADEYDVYADRVYVMLMDKRAAAGEIAAYLLSVAIGQMGLSDDGRLADKCDRVARLLVSIRPQFEAH